MFCRSLFVLFLWVIVLSVLLRYTVSDCPFWYLQTLLDGNLKSIDSWIRIIPLVFCGSYNVPSLISKSLKEAFKQVWFFPKALPTMVHGTTFHIITWQLLSRGSFYPPHGGSSLGWAQGTFNSSQMVLSLIIQGLCSITTNTKWRVVLDRFVSWSRSVFLGGTLFVAIIKTDITELIIVERI